MNLKNISAPEGGRNDASKHCIGTGRCACEKSKTGGVAKKKGLRVSGRQARDAAVYPRRFRESRQHHQRELQGPRPRFSAQTMLQNRQAEPEMSALVPNYCWSIVCRSTGRVETGCCLPRASSEHPNRIYEPKNRIFNIYGLLSRGIVCLCVVEY